MGVVKKIMCDDVFEFSCGKDGVELSLPLFIPVRFSITNRGRVQILEMPNRHPILEELIRQAIVELYSDEEDFNELVAIEQAAKDLMNGVFDME